VSTSPRAYLVREAATDNGGIVFAKTLRQARRDGARDYADGDEAHVICFRAKWADWCAPAGIVQASLLVEYGWRFECTGCTEEISLDTVTARGLSVDDVIGVQNGPIYCCAACHPTNSQALSH
jgi:hypothetical protein